MQAAADTVGGLASADHRITSGVGDGEARLRSVSADPEFTDHALTAAKPAARELDRLSDEYDVTDPVAAADAADYRVVDQPPA